MASNADSIRGYFHILQTTRRSECWLNHGISLSNACHRILIASIRNLGVCPCPRCLISLNRVHNLGMVRDMTQRRTLARVDDNHRRGKVLAARRVIYEKNYQVNSAAVEAILQKESWVPTVVWISLHLMVVLFTHTKSHRTRSLIGCRHMDSICSRCCFQT